MPKSATTCMFYPGITEYERVFSKIYRSFSVEVIDRDSPNDHLKEAVPKIVAFVELALRDLKGLKFSQTLKVEFRRRHVDETVVDR